MGGSRERRGSVFLTLSLLLLLPLASSLGAPSTDAPPQHRAPIRIVGDAGFADPLSGVRGGTGTADDPFIIRDWTILRSSSTGIAIEGTSAHVVIEDVVVRTAATAVHEGVACELGLVGCPQVAGVHLRDASNVTIRRVRVEGSQLLSTHGVRDILVEELPAPTDGLLFPGPNVVTNSFTLHLAERVVFERLTIADDSWIRWAQGVSFDDVRFIEGQSGLEVHEASGIAIRDSTFDFSGLFVGDGTRVDDVRITGTRFVTTAWIEISGIPDDPSHGLVFCGNLVDDMLFTGSWFSDYVGARIAGNRFVRGETDLVDLPGLTFEGNAHGPAHGQTRFASAGANVHGNAWDTQSLGARFTAAADATGNWWGSADGPSGDGPGSGAPIDVVGTTTPYAPWLDAAPEVEAECAGEQPPGA